LTGEPEMLKEDPGKEWAVASEAAGQH
jgi:hypothetical protein